MMAYRFSMLGLIAFLWSKSKRIKIFLSTFLSASDTSQTPKQAAQTPCVLSFSEDSCHLHRAAGRPLPSCALAKRQDFLPLLQPPAPGSCQELQLARPADCLSNSSKRILRLVSRVRKNSYSPSKLYGPSPNSSKFTDDRQGLLYSRLAGTLSPLCLPIPSACMDHGVLTTPQPTGSSVCSDE